MRAVTLQPAELIRVLQSPWAARAGYLINILLVVWIAWLLSTATWALVGSSKSAETLAVETAVLTANRNPYAVLLSAMPGWHLMGEMNASASVKSTVPTDAPDTRLKLVLSGVLAAEIKENARALIAEPNGRTKHYAIGDTLPGKAELREIHADRVILFRGGRYETLRLKLDDYGDNKARVSSRAALASTSLKGLQKRAIKNPKSLYGLISVKPKRDDKGRMVGYTLNPGKEPRLFEDVGLQPGDIAIEVNGEKLDTARAGGRALRQIIDGAVTLVVLRNGVEETITVDIPQ